MRVIHHTGLNPYFNLALEEYLLREMEGDFFVLWRNPPAIIVGRNQNTLAEVNYDYVTAHNIAVVRRMTGGGAVFHDLGNINYTFIQSGAEEHFSNYAFFCEPILEVLRDLGVPASLKGRNDLVIEDKKFSGNAQCAWHGRILHHGTLMFSANVSHMTQALHVNPLKIQSKGIKSVRSRVTNISEHLKEPISIEQFSERVLQRVENQPGCSRYDLTEQDRAAVQKLVDEKYATWEWNYGFKKEYTVSKESLFASGLFDVKINIEEDHIKEIRIFGDYFGQRDVEELEQKLTGVAYDPESLRAAVAQIDLSAYFSGLGQEEFLQALL